MRRMGKALLVGVLAGVTVVGMPAVNEAARKKAKLVARVSGKPFRANLKPSITGAYTNIVVTMTGLFTKISLRGGKVKTLTISCGLDLTTATLPVTVDCAGAYSDNTYSGPVPPANPKAWAAANGLMVTFQSFDGTRVTGTFEGSLPAGDTNPTDPPATFQRGKFAMNLVNAS